MKETLFSHVLKLCNKSIFGTVSKKKEDVSLSREISPKVALFPRNTRSPLHV